jgi:hypothetical protein
LLPCFLPSLSPFRPSFPLLSLFFFAISYNQCCGLVSVRIRIQLFISMRIWNLGVESIRIRILVRLLMFFRAKYTLSTGGNSLKNIHTKYKSLFERQKSRFICKFGSVSMLLVSDSDSHS